MAELTTVAQRKSYRYDKRIEYSLNSLEQTVCQEDYLLVKNTLSKLLSLQTILQQYPKTLR